MFGSVITFIAVVYLIYLLFKGCDVWRGRADSGLRLGGATSGEISSKGPEKR